MADTQRVNDLLQAMPTEGLNAAKALFWRELNYDRANQILSLRNWPRRVQDALAEPPLLLATYEGEQPGVFDIVYARLAEGQTGRGYPLSLTAERLVVNQLLDDHPTGLFLFSDVAQEHWHLVNVRYEKPRDEPARRIRRRIFRRIAIGPHERLRTATERVAMLDLGDISPDLFGLSPLTIQGRHDEAFNVEAVTKAFFKEYCAIFRQFQQDLHQQTGDPTWAHDYALQFLNRLMFLYYVQRKRWLGDDPDFLGRFWRSYRQARSQVQAPADSFVHDWLHVLFFEAFNNRFQAGRADYQYFPPEIRQALALAPYLNGGLFRRDDLDRAYDPFISDARFAEIHDFLDSYNFTISEDTPLDQEVAVDPEMIGKVYESLVNVSDEADQRGEAGIFYTPRIEIDLMCRLALVDWLANQMGQDRKRLLYEVIFALEPDDLLDADEKVARLGLWPRLAELLREVSVLDPACGSGSFLVGMLYVLDDLLARANARMEVVESAYERKKRIVGRSLYGVDVMDWAVHVAELRLWLQLLIDTEMDVNELRLEPVLPNLSFKIRCGDSLVQEVGDINMALRAGSRVIPPHLKRRITQLKDEKLEYYVSRSEGGGRTEQQLKHEELRIYRDILGTRAKWIEERLKLIAAALRPRENLFGEITQPQMPLERVKLERERDELAAEGERLRVALQALRSAGDVPFVWDIAFVEIFEGERAGFDIVIGNPPYVRQEAIRDPHQPAADATRANKSAYKKKLARAVYAAWPRTFGYDWSKPAWKLSARSDLYIYFYLYGLSLLNAQGTFCFITSNSWLDVGYGKDLQQFLLTRGQVKLVLDNQVRRSFASADVNTVIVLLGAPQDGRGQRPASLAHTARFVMLTVPFEETLHPVIWEEIEETAARKTTREYRLHPLAQREMLASGLDAEGKRYAGDKWGGKYLRAPDIYWTILEKGRRPGPDGRPLLVRLGDIAEVRRGFTTGANEFFYLNEARIAEWGIEEEFLRPVIKSPRECKRIVIDPADLRFKIFMCHKEKHALRGTAALEYIRWGESRGFHQRPSCRGRRRWWDVGRREGACVNCNYLVGSIMRFFANDRPFYVSDNFQEIHAESDPMDLAAGCNSTVSQLVINVMGRSNFGDGLLKIQTYEVANISVPNPEAVGGSLVSRIMRDVQLLDMNGADRRTLDQIIFDALGLTQGERDAVYEAVVALVGARLRKARSV